jgi:hypothetical protein
MVPHKNILYDAHTILKNVGYFGIDELYRHFIGHIIYVEYVP